MAINLFQSAPRFNTKPSTDAVHRQVAAANRALAAQAGTTGLTPLSQGMLTAQNELQGAEQISDLLFGAEQLNFQAKQQEYMLGQNFLLDLIGSGLDVAGTALVGAPTQPAESMINIGGQDMTQTQAINQLLAKLIGG